MPMMCRDRKGGAGGGSQSGGSGRQVRHPTSEDRLSGRLSCTARPALCPVCKDKQRVLSCHEFDELTCRLRAVEVSV